MDKRYPLFVLAWFLLPVLRVLTQWVIVNWEWDFFFPPARDGLMLNALIIGGIALILAWLYKGSAGKRLCIYVAVVTVCDGINFTWDVKKGIGRPGYGVSGWAHSMMKIVPAAFVAALLTALIVWGIGRLFASPKNG
jgi:hypothetical protein